MAMAPQLVGRSGSASASPDELRLIKSPFERQHDHRREWQKVRDSVSSSPRSLRAKSGSPRGHWSPSSVSVSPPIAWGKRAEERLTAIKDLQKRLKAAIAWSPSSVSLSPPMATTLLPPPIAKSQRPPSPRPPPGGENAFCVDGYYNGVVQSEEKRSREKMLRKPQEITRQLTEMHTSAPAGGGNASPDDGHSIGDVKSAQDMRREQQEMMRQLTEMHIRTFEEEACLSKIFSPPHLRQPGSDELLEQYKKEGLREVGLPGALVHEHGYRGCFVGVSTSPTMIQGGTSTVSGPATGWAIKCGWTARGDDHIGMVEPAAEETEKEIEEWTFTSRPILGLRANAEIAEHGWEDGMAPVWGAVQTNAVVENSGRFGGERGVAPAGGADSPAFAHGQPRSGEPGPHCQQTPFTSYTPSTGSGWRLRSQPVTEWEGGRETEGGRERESEPPYHQTPYTPSSPPSLANGDPSSGSGWQVRLQPVTEREGGRERAGGRAMEREPPYQQMPYTPYTPSLTNGELNDDSGWQVRSLAVNPPLSPPVTSNTTFARGFTFVASDTQQVSRTGDVTNLLKKIRMYLYICIYVYMYIYMYLYICIYIHLYNNRGC
jgi:hypothetical protein